MRRSAALVVVLLALAACNRVRPTTAPIGADAELRQLASGGRRVAYQAAYRYATAGSLAPGVTTRMTIAQRPPTSLRKLETSTTGIDGRTITVRSWAATDSQGNYSCTVYGELGVRCLRNELPPATFHSAQLDDLFDAPRRDGFFSDVSRAAARARIAGQVATCFEAVPAATGTSPRYELCYTADGILLRARRTLSGAAPSSADTRRDAVVEAVTLSRSVSAADLRLPGPVTDPRDLQR